MTSRLGQKVRVPGGGGLTGWTSVGEINVGPLDIEDVPVPLGMQARFWWSVRSASEFSGDLSAQVSFTTVSGDTTPGFQQSTGKALQGFYSASGGGFLLPTGSGGVYTFALDLFGLISDGVLFVDVVTSGAANINVGS